MFSNLDRSPAVKYLLIINIVIFLILNIGLIPNLSIFYSMSTLHYIDNPYFGFWQFVTHMFLHGSISHIFLNMFALFQFGAVMEQHWGTKKFVIFYFVAGLGGALLYTFNLGAVVNYISHSYMPISDEIINTLPSQIQTELIRVISSQAVGASAAIMGVVVAFAYLHPNTELMLMFIPIPIKAKYLVGAVLVWDLVAGFLSTMTLMGKANYNDGIAHFAHLGGALFGMLLLMNWQKNRNNFY